MLSIDDEFKPVAMTAEEYLRYERAAEARHEYRDGIVYQLPGATCFKSRIGLLFCCTCMEKLHPRTCVVLTCNMRVYIPASGWYVYPDCTVMRGRLEIKDEVEEDNLLNPCVVLQIYSERTEAYFRQDKFAHYKTIPSLAHYVIASQEKPLVEVFTRQLDGSWTCVKYEPGQKIALSAIECEIEVDQVYGNVFDVDVEFVAVP